MNKTHKNEPNKTFNADHSFGRALRTIAAARHAGKAELMKQYEVGPRSLAVLRTLDREAAPIAELRERFAGKGRRACGHAGGFVLGGMPGAVHGRHGGHGGAGHPRGHRRGRLSQVLVRLSERGLINLTDGEAAITDQGRQLLADFRATREQRSAELRSGISDKDWETTQETLRTIAEKLPRQRKQHGHGAFARPHRSWKGRGMRQFRTK